MTDPTMIDPTPEMIEAGVAYILEDARKAEPPMVLDDWAHKHVRAIWRVMEAARPMTDREFAEARGRIIGRHAREDAEL